MLSATTPPMHNADRIDIPSGADPRVAEAREMVGVNPQYFDASVSDMLTRTEALLDAGTPPAQLLEDAADSVVGALAALKGFATAPRLESIEQAASQAIDAAAQITAATRTDSLAVRDAVAASAHLRMAEETFGLEGPSPAIGLQTAQRHVDSAAALLASTIGR